MTTSAESIVFTIVEGCGASTQKEFARFLEMSIKSACELESQVEMACDYEVLLPRKSEALVNETIEIRKMTFTLRKKVLQSP